MDALRPHWSVVAKCPACGEAQRRSCGAIPERYSKSIVEGVRIALEGEMVVGHRVVDERSIDDVVVRVVGGSYDEIDSNDLAFKMAGIFAVKDALKKTEPMRIE